MQTINEQVTAIDLFETGLRKSDIRIMAATAVDSVLEKGNVLQVAEALSAMEGFVKEVKDDPRFKDYVREEAGKTPKGFISNSGAKIECCEVGSSYDFSKCGDAEFEMLESALRSAENSLKERKEFLKRVPIAGIDVIVPYTGEVVHIYPPSKTSTSSYKITLAK